jgi:RimJ/RimL family protein N-acetyltransferase
MHVFLETERLMLRRLTAADVDHLVELDSDPAVMRFLTGGAATPRDVIEQEILPRFLRSYEPYDGFGVWAAIEKATGDFLGWFSLRPEEGVGPDEVSLGYRLRRVAWGKGYATEGARALIRKAFAELGVRRVVATTYQDNLASRRVMEKAGLRLVRTFRITPEELAAAGTFQVTSQEPWDGDDVEYALDKANWEQQEAAGRAQPASTGGAGAQDRPGGSARGIERDLMRRRRARKMEPHAPATPPNGASDQWNCASSVDPVSASVEASPPAITCATSSK